MFTELLAGATGTAPALTHQSVGRSELVTSNAVGLLGVDRSGAPTTHGVLGTSHHFQVREEVHAVPSGTPPITDMVDGQFLRYRRDEVVVGPTMGRRVLPTNLEDAVALSVGVGGPRPALVIGSPVNVRPEAGLVVSEDVLRLGPAVSLTPVVVGGAQTSRKGRVGAFGAGLPERRPVVLAAQPLPESHVGALVDRTLRFLHSVNLPLLTHRKAA
jgi:hypothetical protein